MKYHVRILRRALADLREIKNYIARDAPETAQDFVDELFETISGLAHFPNRGSTPRDSRLRKLGFRFLVQHPYLIFFKVRGASVRVYRVLHGSRGYVDLL
ncbi:MAG: type II toxin-antitoxin system RelE/ParE family toxin [Planctomycetes bacterium]|nr:type II toxin-antitoxin system RelE/ParE family toxin [Planctomycetota bacterium]